MQRSEILSRLKMKIPPKAQLRVIVYSDLKNEADDQFAVMHHLLTPNFDVRGVIAAHFETKAPGTQTTMEQSYRELQALLAEAEMQDVAMLRGCKAPLASAQATPYSEGVQFIINEALRDDPRPLYIAVQGTLTDVAAALNRCPKAAARMTVVWVGGGPYPQGGREFNLMQDVYAAQAVFASPVALWQIPVTAYAMMEVTLAELASRVRPCGRAGAFLYNQLEEYNLATYQPSNLLRLGENWCLGDQPAVGVLLQCSLRGNFRLQPAPQINEDMTYTHNPGGKSIRVYSEVDVRMILEDFYAKLKLCYGSGGLL